MLSTLVATVNAAQSGLYYALYGSYKTGFILVTFLKSLLCYISLFCENLVTILLIFGESVTIFLQDILQYLQNVNSFSQSSFEALTTNIGTLFTAAYTLITSLIQTITSFCNGFFTTLWNIIANIGQLAVIIKKFIVLLGSGIWFAVTLIPLLMYYFMKLLVTLIQEIFQETCQVIANSVLTLVTAVKNVILFTIDVPIESLFGLLIALSLAYVLVQFYVLISTNLIQVWHNFKSIVRRLKTRLFASIGLFLSRQQTRIIYRRQVRENQNREILQEPNATLGRPEARSTIRNGPETRLQRKRNQTPKIDKSILNLEKTEDKLCVICQERNKCILLLPCRHVCLCSECNRELRYYNNVCPICRTHIESNMKIFV